MTKRATGPHGGVNRQRNTPRLGPRTGGVHAKNLTTGELMSPTLAAAERVAFAQKWLFKRPGPQLIEMIMEHYRVARPTAYRDMLDARELVIADSIAERPFVRAWATAQFRTIANEARAAKQYAAAAAAIREIGKLHGAYEPDRISLIPNESLELSAIIGVLDDDGQAALDILLAQIERAKAAGRFTVESAPPVPADVELSTALALGSGDSDEN